MCVPARILHVSVGAQVAAGMRALCFRANALHDVASGELRVPALFFFFFFSPRANDAKSRQRRVILFSPVLCFAGENDVGERPTRLVYVNLAATSLVGL